MALVLQSDIPEWGPHTGRSLRLATRVFLKCFARTLWRTGQWLEAAAEISTQPCGWIFKQNEDQRGERELAMF